MKRYDPAAERERLEKSIHDLTNKILEIGFMLDDDSISDSEFSRLEKEEIEVIAKIGKHQTRADFLNVRIISSVNDWIAEFLESFEAGTRKVSNRQGETFRKINNGKPFIYKGRRYDCRGANYRAGFGTLIITDLESTEIWPETETTETETTDRDATATGRRFYDTEHGVCMTDFDLLEEWENDPGLQQEYPRFSWYVAACQTYQGGTLEEIR